MDLIKLAAMLESGYIVQDETPTNGDD